MGWLRGWRGRARRRAVLAAAALACCGLGLIGLAQAVTPSGRSLQATEGASFSGVVAEFSGVGGPPSQATINWGDGSVTDGTVTAVAPGTYDVSGTHTWGDEGVFTVTTTISGTAARVPYSSTAQGSASVADAALSAGGSAVTATKGSAFNGSVASFTDANPGASAADFSATIDWGDGSGAASGTIAASGAGFSVSGSHTWQHAGSYAVKVSIADRGGAKTEATTTATVAAVVARRAPPVVRLFTLSTGRPRPGQRVRMKIDARPPPGQRMAFYVWHFGDGKRVPRNLGGVKFPAGDQATSKGTVSHRFPRTGKFTVNVEAVDSGGGMSSYEVPVLVCPHAVTNNALAAAGCPKQAPGIDAAIHWFGDPYPNSTLTFMTVGSPAQGGSQAQPFETNGQFPKSNLPPSHTYSYEWNFEDGSAPQDTDGSPVQHSFPTPGNHPISLTVLVDGKVATVIQGNVKLVDPPVCGAFEIAGFPAATDDNCMTELGWIPGAYEASQVTVAGVTFRPYQEGHPIFVDTQKGTITGGPGGGGGVVASLAKGVGIPGDQFDLNHSGSSLTLPANGAVAGLHLVSGSVVMHNDGTSTLEDAQVRLPNPPFGGGVTSLPKLGGDQVANGSSLDFGVPPIPSVSLGALDLGNVQLHHNADGTWSGTASLTLPSGIDLGGVAIVLTPAGSLASLSANLGSPPLPVPLGGGLALDALSFGTQLQPTTLQGSATIATQDPGPLGNHLVGIDGCTTIAIGGAADVGRHVQLCDSPGFDEVMPPGGELYVRGHGTLSIVGIPFANGSFDFHSSGPLFDFGAGFDYDVGGLGLLTLDGAVAGQIQNLSKWEIQANLDVTEHIIGDHSIASVDMLVSSLGVAGCVTVLGQDAGGWYKWSGAYHLGIWDCDDSAVNPFASSVALPSAADLLSGGERWSVDSAAAHQVRLRKGPPFAVIEVKGQGGAPRVTVSGPGGRRIVDNGQLVMSDGSLGTVAHSSRLATTFVRIERPGDGIWTVDAQPGSPAIASLSVDDGLPQPRIRATVTGRGNHRLLRYRLTPIPGQSVTFAEQGKGGARVIGKARGARGTIAFSPDSGRAGRRRVVALVDQGGAPRKLLTVASFNSPRPALPPNPRALVAKRAHGRVTIRWRRVAGAVRYSGSVAELGQAALGARSRGAALSLPDSDPHVAALVRVSAIGRDGREGKPAIVKLRPLPRRRAHPLPL